MPDIDRTAKLIITTTYTIGIPCSVGVINNSVAWGTLTLGLLVVFIQTFNAFITV